MEVQAAASGAAVVALTTLVALFCRKKQTVNLKSSIRKRTAAKRSSNRKSNLINTDILSCATFKRTFRMSRSSFEMLCQKAAPFLQAKVPLKASIMREKSGNRLLTIFEKMAVTIRILAGGSYLDLVHGWDMAASEVYSAFHQGLKSILEGLEELRFPLNDAYLLQARSEGFQRGKCSHEALRGCVMVIDGYAVRIQSPNCANPLTYVNRKGFYSLNVQAGCGSDMQFAFLSCKTAGSTHDAVAWAASGLADDWAKNASTDRLGRRFWIGGDEAYPASANFVTPWPGRQLKEKSPYKDAFNYFYAAGYRNAIERAFGLMYQRWGILWRPIRFHLKATTSIIMALAKLHNFCIQEKEQELPWNTGPGSIRPTESVLISQTNNIIVAQYPLPQSDCADVRLVSRARDSCEVRKEMTALLEETGQLRVVL
jgi:hypothetical protein